MIEKDNNLIMYVFQYNTFNNNQNDPSCIIIWMGDNIIEYLDNYEHVYI